MRQLLQNVQTGESLLADVPAPQPQDGFVQVRVAASLVSAGTERAVVDFGRKSMLEKARSRPDLVRQTIDKARRQGILSTVETVRSRLGRPMALGYSCSGVVQTLGRGVTEFQIGQPVACAGAGYAVHAECTVAPVNLITPIPKVAHLDSDSAFEAAAFTTLGAIAMQGVRLAKVRLGDVVGVIGLGLLGQLTVQILKAAGCRVIGMDVQPSRAALAGTLGADAIASTAAEMSDQTLAVSQGAGADAVLITADTASDQPVALAGAIARDRGVVVAVGSVGMNLPRRVYYDKELAFLVSRSYGPGRYDRNYEEKGHDYPIGYVRWTEKRNMHAFVTLIAEGKVNAKPLITHRFPIENAVRAYDLISGKAAEPFLGIVLKYPSDSSLSARIDLSPASGGRVRRLAKSPSASAVKIGLLGAGSFAQGVLLPALKHSKGTEFVGVAAAGGLGAHFAASKFGFKYCTTREGELLEDPNVEALVIATRHDLHARQVANALAAGKHVFVEKPLALDEVGLQQIMEAYEAASSRVLMAGFNRRFAPMAIDLKLFFERVADPVLIQYRVNAGFVPANHWTQDPTQGGRILGEACHFIDWAGWFAGAPAICVTSSALPDGGRYSRDNVVITLRYSNGSTAVITYLANGDRGLGKERIEVHGGGRSGLIDDFRRLELVKDGHRRVRRSWLRQDKGHRTECERFVAAVRSGAPAPIAADDLWATARTTFAAVKSLEVGQTVSLAATGAARPSAAPALRLM
jgi:predicted dehydrogenase/threonine dehydrogenase-like Zn-dependent dehydrogenase